MLARLRRVEFEVLRRLGEGWRWVEVWQVERGGDFVDFCWVLEEGDDFHGSAAFVADEGVDFLDSLDATGPGS